MKYVVAHEDWPNGPHIYTFGQQIQSGDSGEWLLEWAKSNDPQFNWKIYEVELKEL